MLWYRGWPRRVKKVNGMKESLEMNTNLAPWEKLVSFEISDVGWRRVKVALLERSELDSVRPTIFC